jgi:peptidoglycan-N-acetylglucosamine deacetylase
MHAMFFSVAAGVGALVVAGYNTMSPTSQLYGRTFVGEDRGSRRLALTYDDGPNDPHTLHLLDVLSKHGIKATFFVVGKLAARRPDVLKKVAEGGHEIGNHTYTHPNLIFRSGEQTCREIGECDAAIKDALGSTPRLFRPPYGGRRPANLRAVAAAGKQAVMWSVSGYDWRARSATQIVEKVARQVRGGDVILLHDGDHLRFGADRSYIVQATDELIRRYHGEGYEFVTVTEMMGEASVAGLEVSGHRPGDSPTSEA